MSTERSEKSILNAGLIAASSLPETMVWRNNTGMAWIGDAIPTRMGQSVRMQSGMVLLRDARPFRAGLVGSADVLGVTRGRAVALEAKDATGRMSDAQMKFKGAFEAAGGFYGLFRHEDDLVQMIRGL